VDVKPAIRKGETELPESRLFSKFGSSEVNLLKPRFKELRIPLVRVADIHVSQSQGKSASFLGALRRARSSSDQDAL
jgi:hypothetical protein